MAFRRNTRSSSRSRSTRSRAPARRRSTGRVRSTSRRAAPQTLRLVIETTPASSVARPDGIGSVMTNPRKAKF